jgi:hypothetical protein
MRAPCGGRNAKLAHGVILTWKERFPPPNLVLCMHTMPHAGVSDTPGKGLQLGGYNHVAVLHGLPAAGTKIAQLEAKKRAAVEDEDYDLAKELKMEVDKLRRVV